jgi:hypothetical protein
MENATIFGVQDMIHLTVANSHPWPLGDKMFNVGLVDGFHRGSAPARDFINMSKRVTDFIILDDVNFIRYPYIAMLANRLHERPEWKTVGVGDKVVIFERAK